MTSFRTSGTFQGVVTRGRTLANALALLVIAGAAASQMGCANQVSAVRSRDILTSEKQAALTPERVIADLKAGNQRFITDKRIPRDYLAQAKATAEAQHPEAFVLACIDSRVPVELVFDQSIGDLFVGRVAGNFENTDMLGSMEYATKVAGAKVIVVLGHTGCGAIKGACDNVQLGNLTGLLENLRPAVAASQSIPQPHSSKNHAFVHAVTRANVVETIANITERSPVIAELVAQGKLKVVGAIYDVASGSVDWL